MRACKPLPYGQLTTIFHEKIDGDAQGFIAYFDATGEAIVAFKGTDLGVVKDIEIDINFLPQDCRAGLGWDSTTCYSRKQRNITC